MFVAIVCYDFRRKDEPGPGAFICSCHFKDGNKNNLPEIFTFSKGKKFEEHHLSPEKKQARKPFCHDLPSTSTGISIDVGIPSTSKAFRYVNKLQKN